jgi:hypothetical protein
VMNTKFVGTVIRDGNGDGQVAFILGLLISCVYLLGCMGAVL